MSWIRKWKTNKSNYSWRRVDRACGILAKQILANEVIPTCLISIARGGMVPGAILANKLKLKQAYSIGLSSYKVGHDGLERPGVADIYQNVNNIELRTRNETCVPVVVDDISDRGGTFKHVVDMLSDKVDDIITVSLVSKQETQFKPNYVYESVPQDVWVVFPWE